MAARNALTAFFVLFASLACRAPAGMPAAEGRIVTLHYTVKSGDVFVDSTETKGPATVRLGTGDGLLLGLRKGVVGLKPGEERAFNIPPEDGFFEGVWKGRMLQARVKVIAVREEEK